MLCTERGQSPSSHQHCSDQGKSLCCQSFSTLYYHTIWSLPRTIMHMVPASHHLTIWSLPRTNLQYGPCLAPSCIWPLPRTIIIYSLLAGCFCCNLPAVCDTSFRLLDTSLVLTTRLQATATVSVITVGGCLQSMSCHACATACCPVIPTFVAVLYLLPFLVSNVWFYAVHGSVPAGRHSLRGCDLLPGWL